MEAKVIVLTRSSGIKLRGKMSLTEIEKENISTVLNPGINCLLILYMSKLKKTHSRKDYFKLANFYHLLQKI